MELLFLGTGSGVPAKGRNTQSIVLKMLNDRNEMWMFDCGEATQHQILRTSLKPRKITKIFISHMHGDHIYGLPGFLSSRSFQGGDDNLTIYGPRGIKDYVMMSLKLSHSHLAYFIHFVEIEDQEGCLFEDESIKVTYALLDHGLPSYGFRVEEKTKTGTLLVDKLIEEGIPSGPIYGQLKAGQSVLLEDGRRLDSKDYLGRPIPGRVMTIISDTRPCLSRYSLAQEADVLIHEGTFSSQDAKLAHTYFHSTVADAAQLAEQAGVGQLLITHISSRYVGQAVKTLEKEAQAIFPKSNIVKDFYSFQIK